MGVTRTVVAVAVAAIAATTLAGCDKSSYTCHNGSCDVTVSGTPKVDFGSDYSDHRHGHHHDDDSAGPEIFEVTGYQGDAVSISSNGDQGTVRTGESKRIGELTFRLVSVKGESAKLHVDM